VTKTQKRVLLIAAISMACFFAYAFWMVFADYIFEQSATQSNISGPKGDGFYTIGVEISSGIWESQGKGTTCYWEVLDQNQDIVKNHHGHAVGTVNLNEGYEFHSKDCGEWVKR
jgi:hypothetical protein